MVIYTHDVKYIEDKSKRTTLCGSLTEARKVAYGYVKRTKKTVYIRDASKPTMAGGHIVGPVYWDKVAKSVYYFSDKMGKEYKLLPSGAIKLV